MTLSKYHNLFVLHEEGEWRGGEVFKHWNSFVKNLTKKGFVGIGAGGTRKVFARKNIVIKVPLRGDGIIDNIVEHKLWHKYRDRPTSRNLRVAPCRILPNGCLMMVKVNRKYSHEIEDNYPWIANMADSFQGGFYKDKMVVFDFALEAPEREEWEKELGVRSEILHCSDWQSYRKKVLGGDLTPFIEKDPVGFRAPNPIA